MKGMHAVAFILLVVGGLNWLLIGIGGWNIVSMVFGSMMWLERLVYILVGLAALWELAMYKQHMGGSSMPKTM